MSDTFQNHKSDQERRQFWQRHIDSWSATDLSQKEYCRQNSLKSSRFTYWKIKFKKESSPVELVQIHTESAQTFQPSTRNDIPLRLTVDSRFTIDIPDGFTQETLEQVLVTLGRL